MLNTYSNSKGGSASNSLSINAVSGTLVKNHKKSRFIVCKEDSKVFDVERPHIRSVRKGMWESVDVVVLQAMIIKEGLFLCEVVEADDFYDETERKT